MEYVSYRYIVRRAATEQMSTEERVMDESEAIYITQFPRNLRESPQFTKNDLLPWEYLKIDTKWSSGTFMRIC